MSSSRRFEVLSRGSIIGWSQLESGDPPMGVATGRLVPSQAYEAVQSEFVALRDAPQTELALAVRIAGGELLDCSGGVRVEDYSAELAEIHVSVLGIGYPGYGQLFPEHVAAYERQSASGV